jgi:hypothetical protein
MCTSLRLEATYAMGVMVFGFTCEGWLPWERIVKLETSLTLTKRKPFILIASGLQCESINKYITILCWSFHTRGPFIPAAGGRSNTATTGCFEHNGRDSRLSTHLRDRAPLAVNYCVTVSATTRPKLRHEIKIRG